MKAKLITLESKTPQDERPFPNKIIGSFHNFPKLEDYFVFYGDHLDYATIWTTHVKKIDYQDDKICVFETKNTKYQLEVLE